MTDTDPAPIRPRLRWGRRSLIAAAIALSVISASLVARAGNVGFFGRSAGTVTTPGPAASSPTASATPSTGATPGGINVTVGDVHGDHRNVVRVTNHDDGSVRARGHIKLNEITSDSTAPVNEADAFGQCVSCQTIAVAIEINLISSSSHVIRPQNLAVAVNYQCQTCDTIALAYQFNITLPDPHEVPKRVTELTHTMDHELSSIQKGHATLSQIVASIEQVLAQYADLTQYLEQLKHESTAGTDPGATPPPADQASPSAEPSPSTSPSGGTPVASPSASPSVSASPSPSP